MSPKLEPGRWQTLWAQKKARLPSIVGSGRWQPKASQECRLRLGLLLVAGPAGDQLIDARLHRVDRRRIRLAPCPQHLEGDPPAPPHFREPGGDPAVCPHVAVVSLSPPNPLPLPPPSPF